MIPALVLAAAALAPDVDSRMVGGILTALEAGQASAAHKSLEQPNAKENFLADTKALARICEETADSVPRLVKDREGAGKLSALLVEWTGEAAENGAEDALAQRARGHALLASGRITRHVAPPDATADIWTRAADAFEKAYGLDGADGRDAGSAVEALAEGAFVQGADAAALLDRATTLGAAASAKHRSDARLLRRVSLLDLAVARRALAAKDRPGADAAVERAVARLSPLLKGEATDIDIGTAWNEIIDFTRAHPKELKKPKGDYLLVTRDLGQFLQVQVPHSRFWIPSKDGESLYQYTSSFDLLRILSVGAYDWGSEYTLADGSKVGGDNIKGLASNEYEVDLRGLREVKGKKPPVRARLNGRVDEGWAYEYQGIDRDKDFLSDRSWYFKSKAGWMHTFRFTIWEYREGVAADALAKAVIESVREKPKK